LLNWLFSVIIYSFEVENESTEWESAQQQPLLSLQCPHKIESDGHVANFSFEMFSNEQRLENRLDE
jgi:hypothetical protein